MKEFFPTLTYSAHELEVKKSRFITHIAHTPSIEEAKSFIQKIRLEHPKANHNCSAYIAGSHFEVNNRGADDDGEPKGTAGKPMLNVLEHNQVCEICVVITRYFGGIKLGAGGLVRAYSQATQEALQQIDLTEKIETHPYILHAPHHLVGEIEHKLQTSGLEVTSRDWSEDAIIRGKGTLEAIACFRLAISSVAHLIDFSDERS